MCPLKILLTTHKCVITFVISDFINLIVHSQWKYCDRQFSSQKVYDVDRIEDGRYVIDEVRNYSNRFNAYESTWKMKLGVKYSF